MHIDIINKQDAPLLSRQEIQAKIGYTGKVPSRRELIGELAKKLNAKPELLVIKKIKPRYGLEQADITAYAYASRDWLDKVEKKYILARSEPKKEQADSSMAETGQAGRQAEKKEEAKPEEKKQVAPESGSESGPSEKQEVQQES
jgi:ribosomal protein S24E